MIDTTGASAPTTTGRTRRTAEPQGATANDSIWKKLHEPFGKEKIKQKRGQGNRMMSYISHGLITERLNAADPAWSSEVLTEHIYKDGQGRLHCEGVTLALTINGVTRVEAGGPQRQDGFANEIKNAYSDALKRCAMRFGVALEMWEELVDAEFDEDVYPEEESHVVYSAGEVKDTPAMAPRPTAAEAALRPAARQEAPRTNGRPEPASDKQLKMLWGLAKQKGKDADEMKGIMRALFNKESTKVLTKSEASTVIDMLQEQPDVLEQAPMQETQKGHEEPSWLYDAP